MIILKNCILCNNTSLIDEGEYVDYSCSKEIFKIVSCETCGFKFTNPRPKKEEIKKYYLSEDYISHTNNKKGLVNWLYQKIRTYTIKRKTFLLKNNCKKGRHLDIGCGTGEFLDSCKKEGFSVQGIEPSKKARQKAIKNYNLNVYKEETLANIKSLQFDSISMWHVLEHIYDLKQYMNDISRILKKEGRVIVAVPNPKSWDCLHYKEFWAAWDVPLHLWHFSKENIIFLFEKYGLECIKTKPMIFDSFYISILSEKFKFGKQNLIKSFLIGLYSNILGLITKKGCSSTIYIFEKKRGSFKPL